MLGSQPVQIPLPAPFKLSNQQCPKTEIDVSEIEEIYIYRKCRGIFDVCNGSDQACIKFSECH